MYWDGNTVFCREIDAISKCMMNLSQVKRNSVAPCSLCCSSQIINLRVNLWEHPFPRCYGTLLCSLKNWHVSLASGGQRNHLWKQQPLISCFFFIFVYGPHAVILRGNTCFSLWIYYWHPWRIIYGDWTSMGWFYARQVPNLLYYLQPQFLLIFSMLMSTWIIREMIPFIWTSIKGQICRQNLGMLLKTRPILRVIYGC